MAFNFGVSNNGKAASYSMQSNLYDSAMYRRWVVDVAISFYTGRSDTYIWLDLKDQFRNPNKQQIIPYNLTQEIIDETSILYREEPIYQIKDKESGKVLKKDQDLWKRIRKDSRYHNMCQQLDSMTKLLGTVLVKVSFVDPDTGDLVNANKPGMVEFELVYGGSYDVKYATSPYYLSSIEFGMVDTPSGWASPSLAGALPINPNLSVAMKPKNSMQSFKQVSSIKDLRQESINKVYWNKKEHKVQDAEGNFYEGENPYGCIPAVPFFNSDPGNRYFLPVNEPLLYANHAVNMRLTDLNHIAKFQSFGQAVVKGIERPVNNRLGRPIDDMNARGGSRGTGFGFGGGSNVGPSGLDRNSFNPFDFYGDGNAQANMNGFSLGPDTIVSVGETGDFRFETPGADITGLTGTIYTMMDMVRINHGLQPKHNSKLPPSGAALMAAKLGVVEQNKRRQILFREREQQLFEIIKKLWNAHHDGEKGSQLFSEDAELEIHYVEPEFAVDPQTRATTVKMNQDILNTGSYQAIQKINPHLDELAIKELIEKSHKERIAQAERDAEIEAAKILKAQELGVAISKDAEYQVSTSSGGGMEINAAPKPKIDNPAKHAEQSSIQPGRNGDGRKSDKTKRVEKQSRKESGFKE